MKLAIGFVIVGIIIPIVYLQFIYSIKEYILETPEIKVNKTNISEIQQLGEIANFGVGLSVESTLIRNKWYGKITENTIEGYSNKDLKLFNIVDFPIIIKGYNFKSLHLVSMGISSIFFSFGSFLLIKELIERGKSNNEKFEEITPNIGYFSSDVIPYS